MLRGRLRLLLADVALRRGRIANAFTHAQFALREFNSAGFDANSWRAASLLFTAILYAQLGANDEALGALAESVDMLAPLHAPSRMATAMNVYADVQANLHHASSALWWRRMAEATFARLAMIPAAQATHALRLDMEAQLGDSAALRTELQSIPPGDALHAAQPLLVAAELALREDRLDAANTALNRVRAAPLTLRQQIRAAVLEAHYLDRSGHPSAAQQTLRGAAQRLRNLAQRAGNPVLRQVIERQQSMLRQTAFRLLLDNARAVDLVDADVIWRWLASEAPGSAPTAGALHPQSAKSFDRAAAAELLAPPGRPSSVAETNSRRELLALLSDTGYVARSPYAAAAPIALKVLQQRLAIDAALIAYVDGGTKGALLWVTHDNARIVATAPPDEVRASIIQLRESVHNASTPTTTVIDAARELSTRLLRRLSENPPLRLYVVADEPMNGVVWSLLPWPGRDEALIDSTAVSLVHVSNTHGMPQSAATRAPDRLHVVVAAQTPAAGLALHELAGASVEAGQIRAALGATPRIDENDQATAAEVLGLLGERASWIHVAAHGVAQAQRIGFAGIWLQPAGEPADPAFLSWLDVLDNGARADLVVLDACQLGDSGAAISGNLSFADAVSRAGARRVVSALWPVSDAASALWVPEFYRTLVADPRLDVPAALRAVQLRLRASRAFTHPFFWAGFQAIERLDLAAADAPGARGK